MMQKAEQRKVAGYGIRLFMLLAVFLLMNAKHAYGQTECVCIHGKVTDFSGQAVEGALIMLKGENFGQFVDTTHSHAGGHYALHVKPGRYSGLAAVRMSDYGKTKLEFWAYELPADKDIALDIRYDRLEVYGLNVFKVQGAYPGYVLYCRPMSLTRAAMADMKADIPEIAPPADKLDVTVLINEEAVKINSVQRIEEYAGKQRLYAYLIQVDFGNSSDSRYDKIQVIMEDKNNGDRGEAVYFYKKGVYADSPD